MTIGQVLMKTINTSGGLTGGLAIYESALARWIQALPLTLPLCNNLENFAGVAHEASEQHRELRPSRQTKDNEDVDCFIKWLSSHSPFESRPANMLVSLSTGLIANECVNCDCALSVAPIPKET